MRTHIVKFRDSINSIWNKTEVLEKEIAEALQFNLNETGWETDIETIEKTICDNCGDEKTIISAYAACLVCDPL